MVFYSKREKTPVRAVFSRLKRFWHFSFRSDALSGCLEMLRMAAEWICLHNGFLERTERRASEAPAGLPRAGRRPAEKIGAGFIM
ncbi:hypothetical protein B4110_3610 [Parageobacillus toebii]|uniref:Transposase DDE domain-containing protein n=1 Tax=Parageobacillus toebii TaxID=153151 RepID=A0A150N7V0_9BACL|nr:hypothetical protein B4110_3610 [Parageobacillus toebii]